MVQDENFEKALIDMKKSFHFIEILVHCSFVWITSEIKRMILFPKTSLSSFKT